MKRRNGIHETYLLLTSATMWKPIAVFTNVPDVMPPPVTGTIEEKAVIMLERLQLAFVVFAQAQENPWINDGWISRHYVRAVTGIGWTSQKPVLRYMLAKKWIQEENRNGHWWIKICPAGSGAAPDAPAIDGGDPTSLVPWSAATQQSSSMQQQHQQKQTQQNQPVTTESGACGQQQQQHQKQQLETEEAIIP